MQDKKINGIDYDGVVADIEGVLFDHRDLDVHTEEWNDEDGGHKEHRFYASQKQKDKVAEILRKFCLNVLQTYLNKMVATEDAKEMHYK